MDNDGEAKAARCRGTSTIGVIPPRALRNGWYGEIGEAFCHLPVILAP
jgi:hypothetical protein